MGEWRLAWRERRIYRRLVRHHRRAGYGLLAATAAMYREQARREARREA